MLPDAEKERLCRSLLAEFGATRVKEGRDGELIHSCLLPFGGHTHGDLNPSASLNYHKLTYNCLGCQNSGGLLWFIGVCRGTSGTEARSWLEKETGTGPEVMDLGVLLDFFDSLYQPKQHDTTPIPKMSPTVLMPWLQVIHPYLTEIRHIPDRTIIEYQVGWNPTTDRIVIPHFWNGSLVGWQTRRLSDDGTEKYKNSPDFPKDQSIYHYSQRRTKVIVVESPMSVLSKHHVTDNMEATFGAEVTDKQTRLLSIHAQVVLFFDNDNAGWNATQRVGTALLPFSTVWVAKNPFNADPADLDDVTYREAVEEPIPFVLWQRPSPEDLVELVR